MNADNFEILFNGISDFLFVLDCDGLVIRTNKAVLDRLGYSAEEVSTMNVLQFHPPEQRDAAAIAVAGMLEGTCDTCSIPLCHKNGTHVEVETIVSKGLWNERAALFGISRDITCQRQAEQLQRKTMEAVIESLPEATLVVSLDGEVIAWNHRMENLTGIPKQSALGHTGHGSRFYLNGTSLPALNTALLAHAPLPVCDEYHPISHDSSSFVVEAFVKKTTGGGNHYWISAALLADSEGTVIGAMESIRDITEQKKYAIQQSLSQKLESLGHLTASIAHEINTPLQYIGDNTRFVGQAFDYLLTCGVFEALPVSCPAGSHGDLHYYRNEVPLAISETLVGIERVCNLLSAMKSFCHPGNSTNTQSDINQSIRDTVTISQNLWKNHAELILRLDPDLPMVWCNPAEINQALLNLLVNAADAVAEACSSNPRLTGLISIRTKEEPTGILIAIEDNGGGIPEHIKHRIFDPFFTTKEVGKGTGQGLSIARDIIVTRHHGTILADSEVNHGTTFSVRIPFAPPTRPKGPC